MIVMRDRNERVRRRYPATIKKMGKGTLYITTHRIVFESEKYGVCLDLHFKWLHEWYPAAKRKVRLSWHEPDPKTNDVRVTDETFGAEIVLERRQDKWKPDSIEFHYSLCFAYTEWTDDGMLMGGWYFGRDGKVRNHYRLAGPKQKTLDQYPAPADKRDAWLQRGLHDHDTEKEIAKYAKRCTGERLIDQELKWRGVNVEKGTVSLKPRGFNRNGRVLVPTPYEPDYDRLKEYWPVPRVPTPDDMERILGLERSARLIDDLKIKIVKGVKDGKPYKGSREHRRDCIALNNCLVGLLFNRNLMLKMANMQFDTYKQWYAVKRGAEDAFRDSGLKNRVYDVYFGPDRAAVKALPDGGDKIRADVINAVREYEPVIIDMPPAEPYRNKELEDMQGYRRLLVEAA